MQNNKGFIVDEWECNYYHKNNSTHSLSAMSMHNNLNVVFSTDDVNETGPIRHMWEVNNHGEKGMYNRTKKTLLVKRVISLRFYLTNYMLKRF